MPVSLTVQRGARETLETRHRLRIESGRVRLIGIDSYRDDRATGNGTRASTNLLTGLRETEVLRAQRIVRTNRATVSTRPRYLEALGERDRFDTRF
jgi:hypothetical protein